MKLKAQEIKEKLTNLDGWSVENNVLIKEFGFTDFREAMKFMIQLSIVVENLNHHPDWSNSYNKVLIKLTTHSESGLTDKDFKLAQAADKAAKNI